MKNKQGRPSLTGKGASPRINIVMKPCQISKLKALGGAKWIRAMVDNAIIEK